MADGVTFAALATLVGKKNAARWGGKRVTISAVGIKDGERFVMARTADGTVILGEPRDFALLKKLRAVAARLQEENVG